MPQNHSYRLVFNESLGTWVAAPECARGRSKGGAGAGRTAVVAATLLLGAAGLAHAGGPLPTGGQVVGGDGTIHQSGTSLTVRQTSQRLATDWQAFSIGAGHSVTFEQPSASAVALNRVLGSDVSVIQGQLNANGQVFLLNPNGVLFSPTAQVNVGGLLASTLQMSTEDFMAGRYRLDGESTQAVTNQGRLAADRGGFVALVAARVVNDGSISAPGGAALLGAGQTVTLDLGGPVKLQIERGALQAQISNGGAIDAGGGQILLSARAVSALGSSVINQSGFLEASTLAANERGQVVLSAEGGAVIQSGSVRANGVQGGSIEVRADAVIDAGEWQARGQQAGGHIDIAATRHFEQTAAASVDASGAGGGQVRIVSGGTAWLSGRSSADGSEAAGGDVSVTASQLTLAGARLSADGASGGGRVRVGGGWQGGDADLANALRTTVNPSSVLSASATRDGDGGTVVVWSEQGTGAAGSIAARGAGSGDGGQVEVSSRGRLAYGAQVDVTAPQGAAGTVLLDPKNIVIEGSTPPSYTVTPLADPAPAAGENYGNGSILQLANGNIVVGNWNDDTVALNAGAVRLYAPDGTLISTLTGTTANDSVGQTITAVGNGNFVAGSYQWDSGSATDAGAVTWGSGSTGVSGAVSSANSLVGTKTNDRVAYSGVTTLGNGNYLVRSSYWGNGTATDVGAVTWGSGSTGVKGAVSNTNSLVGSSAGDLVGNNPIVQLANGNYLVPTYWWDSGTVVDAGAVTWGSGTAGVSGVVSSSNSLVGSTAYDAVGNGGFTTLSNGNYLVRSYSWSNGSASSAGAVTWGNGTTGVTGVVSSSNSLVGSFSYDQVGTSITVLSNGNYVVGSPNWDNSGVTDAGAATWGSGTAGVRGVVSSANSLVGSKVIDQVGAFVIPLTNGNYVVGSPLWDNGSIADAGAVTWANGATGLVGAVSSANSLVGSTASDQVGNGSITALSNGNYVVSSRSWNNGGLADAGAVTWGSGAAGVSGAVSSSNSLLGSSAYDRIGESITALANGNYVVLSPYWDNGTVTDAGAATWANGTTGITGTISSSNSLVGSTQSDQVGSGVTALANGNYVVRSLNWRNGSAWAAGAVTWGSGTAGVTGVVDSTNSLVGSTQNDRVGSAGVIGLANGNYVVLSTSWNNGTATSAGAVTWGSGTSGVTGIVDSTNSLVGDQANDTVGSGSVTQLGTGNYLVRSPNWRWTSYSGGSTSRGAVTFGLGDAPLTGVLSSANSLVGAGSADAIGNNGITVLANGNAVISSQNYGGNAYTYSQGYNYSYSCGFFRTCTGTAYYDVTTVVNQLGAVTWVDGTTGLTGTVSASNSLVGSNANDRVGVGGITALTNGNYVVNSYLWKNGTLANAGAVTIGDGAQGTAGTISSSNSFVGAAANDMIGSGGIIRLADDRVLVRSPNANGGAGRVDILAPATAAYGYADNAASDSTIGVAQLKSLLDTGAAVVLQANNDITVNAAVAVDNTAGNGGDLTLQAGRSILVNADITTDSGNLTLIANDRAANGVVDAYRDAGAAAITMAEGTTIDAGTGTVSVQMRDGAGKTHSTAGQVTLATVRAGMLSVDSTAASGQLLTSTKVYDGNDWALLPAGNFSFAGLAFANGSNLSWGGAQARYDSRNAGARTATMVDTVKLVGFNGTATSEVLKDGVAMRLTGNGLISQRALTVTATGQDKVYDGGLAATVTYGDDRVGSDIVSVSGSAAFGTRDVGTGKAVSVSGIAITGSDAGNYTLASTTAATTASITPKALTVTASGQDKVYDGTTAATVVYGDDRVAGDMLSVSGTANFAGREVGTGKAVTASGLAITGADAANYTLAATTAATTASITPKALVVTATGQDKVYDGTSAATVAYGDDRVVGDTLFVSGTASFAGKDVGSNKAVGVNGIAITGADAGNYTLAATTAATTASITPKALTVTATGQDKVYDGTRAATVVFGDDRVLDDALAVTGTASFATRDVGTAKAVSVNGIAITGADAGNYTLSATTAATTASITPKALDVTATGQDKVYDGTTAATVVYGDNRVLGDTLSVSGTADFASRNVGAGQAVNVNGIAITGADAANYTLSATTAATTASITPKALDVTATGQDKVYDGTTAATVAYGDNRVAGDTLAVTGSASFADRNAGTAKAVTASGLALTGADAGNYTLANTTAATTAAITPRALDLTGSKQEDGSAAFAASALAAGNVVDGDIVTLSGEASVASPAAGSYAGFASNTLQASSANYTTKGGAVSVVIMPAPAAAPVAIDVTAAIVTEAEPARDGDPRRRDKLRPPQALLERSALEDPSGLRLQVVGGGIRLPAEAASVLPAQEK